MNLPGLYQPHRELLGTELWSKLCRLAPERRRPTRSVLLRQGDPGTHVLLLTSGAVAIAIRNVHGERTLLAVRGPGELLGELAVLDRGHRSATVIAADPCRVHAVPAPDFRRFVTEHDLMATLLQHAIGRIRESEQIRLELATSPVAIRLASALVRLATPTGQVPLNPPRIRLTQDELAQLIGASRNAVVNVLGPWRKQAWVSTAPGGGLIVHDIQALRRFAANHES